MTGAKENTAKYFRTVNWTQRNQTADSENLSENATSILNDRAFINMPEGAAHMTKKQEKALSISPSYNVITEEYVAWGGQNEVLVLHAEDMFLKCSGDLAKDFRALQYYVEADESEKAVILSDYAVACPMPYNQIRPTFEGEQYILQGMIIGADNTLIRVEFSLYSNEWERMEDRVTFYQELAYSILKTAVPGPRVLGAQAESVRFKQFELQIPKGFCVKNLEIDLKEDDVDSQYSFISIEEIGMISERPAAIRLKITNHPKEIESEIEPIHLEDTLINQEIVWKHKQWSIPDQKPFDVWETFVTCKGKETLGVTLYPEDQDDLQLLFDIIHTLEKK